MYSSVYIYVLIVFAIIIWFQYINDIKYNIKNKSIYEKLKLPTIICILIGIILYYNNILINNNMTKNLYEFNILTSSFY